MLKDFIDTNQYVVYNFSKMHGNGPHLNALAR